MQVLHEGPISSGWIDGALGRARGGCGEPGRSGRTGVRVRGEPSEAQEGWSPRRAQGGVHVADDRFAALTAAGVSIWLDHLPWGRLMRAVGCPNLYVKIPATRASLPAVTEALALGVHINVTLIFSVERYRDVMAAYLAGLERALDGGVPQSGVHSVASFFVSRGAAEVDERLEEIGSDEALALRAELHETVNRSMEAAEQGRGQAQVGARSRTRWDPKGVSTNP